MCHAEDQRKGRVPDGFPGCVGIVREGYVVGDDLLSEDYRKTGGDFSEEFYYFVKRIASSVRVSCKFEELEEKKLLSKILTVEDKAFALLIIDNEHHVWLKQIEFKQLNPGRKAPRYKKRYCDCKSGSKNGWTDLGINIYTELCEEVKVRRRNSRDMEENLRERFRAEGREWRGERGDDETVDPFEVNFLSGRTKGRKIQLNAGMLARLRKTAGDDMVCHIQEI